MRDYIYSELGKVKIIDTHEHFWDEENRLKNKGDWVLLFHQYGKDLFQLAGMTEEEVQLLFFSDASYEVKWSVFARYYPYIKNAECIKSARTAINDIYGIDRIDLDSMLELNKRMHSSISEGFFRKVLQYKCNIDYCMVNTFDESPEGCRYPVRHWGDTDFLCPDISGDELILPPDKAYIAFLMKEMQVEKAGLAGWLEVIDRIFEKYGLLCRAVKIALAYQRDLDYDDSVSYGDAEKSFAGDDLRPASEFIFHYVVCKATEYKLPVKFHTGVHSGCGVAAMHNQEKNAEHLAKLAAKNPNAKIVALHIGFPFEDKLLLATKQFPNIYADMSWIWSISPERAKAFLKNFIQCNAINKLTGFGGDHFMVELSYAYLKRALEHISDALAELVKSGYLTVQDACDIGRIILRDSPEALYGRQKM